MIKPEERVILGSGTVFMKEHEMSAEIPPDVDIETEANKFGAIKGGASLSYSGTFTETTDDFGQIKKKLLTSETVKFSFGVLTVQGGGYEKLCLTAKETLDEATGLRTIKIGGLKNYTGKKYLLRFVYRDEEDGYELRVTILGNNETGFTLAFSKDNGTVVNPEFVATPLDKDGTLLIIQDGIKKELKKV